MNKILLNDYERLEHNRSISEDDYNVSYSCDFSVCDMFYTIHSSIEILFGEAGRATYFIDGKSYILEKNDILVIGSLKYHNRDIDVLPYRRYGLTLMPKYINGFIQNSSLRKVFETPSPDVYETHCRHISEEIIQVLKSNLNELYNEDDSLPFADLNKQLLVENIAVLMYRAFRYEEFIEKKSPYYDKMITVKNFLDNHYAEKISLSDLADKFYLHPTNISKFFSKCFGFSINNYITMRRLSEAQRLLENTDLSINFIAEAVGYCDSTAFVSKYSAITGKTPLQYRKAYRKNF